MTTKELENEIKELFRDADNVEVTLRGDQVVMEISARYAAPGKDLLKLLKLAKLLGTTNIEEDDTLSEVGCDTCDYGSKYGVVLVAPNVGGRISYFRP